MVVVTPHCEYTKCYWILTLKLLIICYVNLVQIKNKNLGWGWVARKRPKKPCPWTLLPAFPTIWQIVAWNNDGGALGPSKGTEITNPPFDGPRTVPGMGQPLSSSGPECLLHNWRMNHGMWKEKTVTMCVPCLLEPPLFLASPPCAVPSASNLPIFSPSQLLSLASKLGIVQGFH